MPSNVFVINPTAPPPSHASQQRSLLTRTRGEVRQTAEASVINIARLLCSADAWPPDAGGAQDRRSETTALADDADAVNRLFRERRWTDGFPVIAPTADRVRRMLRCTSLHPDELVATVASGMGAATVQRIAVNAVMAGCDPEYMPVLIAEVLASSPQGAVTRMKSAMARMSKVIKDANIRAD